MSRCAAILLAVALLLNVNFSAARAVNISNTWMLPEEGFPVFYRHFRDRISWYEADAVCQFHHAYLVTADTTSQYDAIRAYLKELDITNNVWLGLSKTSEKPNFTWTDFRPLSGDGHWQEAPLPGASGKDPTCIAMDPAKDFLWSPLSCGGPEVASFICEMPIPSWALGPKGCLLTELPSLTVLYIPEQSSLELTSDCGLDGTRRIACKGNADREEILRQLTCAVTHEDFEEKEKTTRSSVSINTASADIAKDKTTRPWIWTSNTIDVDYGMPTRHRRETEDTLSPGSTRSSASLSTQTKDVTTSEMFTATNYDTEVTTNSLKNELTTEIPTVSENILETISTNISIPENAYETTRRETVTFVATAETQTTKTETSEASPGYSSAVSQGHLFSIIENGTMFDIIELNDTSVPDREPVSTPTTPSETPYKPSKKLIQVNEKNYKNFTDETAKPKPVTKKDIYKSADPKKANLNLQKIGEKGDKEVETVVITNTESLKLNRTLRKHQENLSKEVPLFPIVKDASVRLNRTFRKELPIEDSSDINLPEPVKTVDNNFIGSDAEAPNSSPKAADSNLDTTLSMKNTANISTTQLIQIDPKIDVLNNNLTTNNDSEFIELSAATDNFEESLKKQLLPKSLQSARLKNDSEMVTHPRVSGTKEDDDDEEQPRPNRQRQLTRPQRKSFYPYIFSRVLG